MKHSTISIYLVRAVISKHKKIIPNILTDGFLEQSQRAILTLKYIYNDELYRI